ncbi:MAG TPA: histidine kinase [Aggregatilineales bacterium]|nr:histidine kinase [Aggregatilineales bacterium]
MDALLSPKEQLIEEIRDKIEDINKRLRENESIIEQNQLEVDRLQSKSVSVSAQLKRIEDQFDSVPRQDIKVAYESAIDTRTRLTSMRSQLEKLKDAQHYLMEFKDMLSNVLGMMDTVSIDRLGAGSDGVDSSRLSLAGEQIVRIVEAQEAERKQLANALHDGPAQSLTNFILQAEICQRLFDRDPDSASQELSNLKASASISFQKVRDFIFELRPMMLDDLGMVATIKRHTENYDQKHENIKVEFHMTGAGDVKRFPSHVEVMMFRGLQVLLNNAVEIHKAKQIDVKLDIGDTRLIGIVEDNGTTFDPEIALDPSQGDNPLQNLLDLRERIEMVGGSLDVFSEEGERNSVEITIPVTELRQKN